MFHALAIRSLRPQFSTRINSLSRCFHSSYLHRQADAPADSSNSISLSSTSNETCAVPGGSGLSIEAPLKSVKAIATRKKRLSKSLDKIPTSTADSEIAEVETNGKSKPRKRRSLKAKVSVEDSGGAGISASNTIKEDGSNEKVKLKRGRKPKAKDSMKGFIYDPKNRLGRNKLLEQEGTRRILDASHLVPQNREKYARDLLVNVTGRSNQETRDRKRVNIVSESLCDDILQRLGPSLEKHKGCDIIDINPGVGVWSTKLHDYLQPRSHILMEPNYEAYKPLLDPFLKAPNSKYRLVPKSGIVWNHLEKILSKEYLPFQEVLEPTDPRVELPNNTLLVIANLAAYPRQAYRRFPSIANLIVHQFLAAARTHSLFHQYGKIRMLLWFNDEDIPLILPRALSYRKRSAIEAEMSCKSIEAVVSSLSTNAQRYRRERSIEFESLERVLENMRGKGISVPDGRKSHLMEELDQYNAGSKNISSFEPRFLHELEELKRRYAAGEFEKFAIQIEETNENDPKLPKGPKPYTVEYERMRYLTVRFKREGSRRSFHTELVDEFDSITALQRKHFTSKSQKTRDSLLLEFQERAEKWKKTITLLPDDEQPIVLYMCDQRHAFQQSPPVLFWDKREAEPLRTNVGLEKDQREFHPFAADLALVDFQPCALPSVVTANLEQNYDVLDYIITKFLESPTSHMNETLKSLWPGAYEWLLVDCPELRDPTKGGSYDFDILRARNASAFMLTKILESWLRWPYRPSRDKLWKSLGAEAYDPDDDID